MENQIKANFLRMLEPKIVKPELGTLSEQENREFELWYESICADSILQKAKQNKILWQDRPLEWDAAYEILSYHEFCGGKLSIEQLLYMSNNRHQLMDSIWPKEPLTREKVEAFYLASTKVLPWGHGIFVADHNIQTRRKAWLRRLRLLEMLQTNGVKSLCDYGAGGGHTSLLAVAMGFERVVHHEYSVYQPYVTWRAERMKAAEQTNCQLEFSAAENPLVVIEPVEAVICTDVAEHVWDPLKMLGDIRNMLKPGGILVWASVFGEGLSSHLHPDLKGREEQLLHQAGFRRLGGLVVWYYGHCGLYEAVPDELYRQWQIEESRNNTIKITCGDDKSHSRKSVSETDSMSAMLERNQWLSPSEVAHYQFRDLKKLIEHSYNNVPFYRRRFDAIGFHPAGMKNMEDFRRIPILKKADIRKHLDEMKAVNCPPEQLLRETTESFAGKPLVFYRDLNAQSLLQMGFLRLRKGWIGYGPREIPAVACECEYHNGMHIFSDLRLVEVMKNDRPAKPGEEGSIVITDLINYGMPFIRYEVGDAGVLSEEICPCGRGFPLIKEVRKITTVNHTAGDRPEEQKNILLDLPESSPENKQTFGLSAKIPTKGLVYVAFGEEYDRLAAHTVAYSRQFTDLPVCIITNLEKRHPKWDEVTGVEFKYLSVSQDDNRQVKTSLDQYSPFDLTLSIDCDSVIQKKGIERIFEWLDDHDVMLRYRSVMEKEEKGFWEIYTKMMQLVGEQFPLPIYSGGLIGFRKNNAARKFFDMWNAYWKLSGKGRDMPALACTAKRTKAKIRIVTNSDKVINEETNVINFENIIHHRWLDQPGVKSFFEVFNIPQYKQYKPFDKKPQQVNSTAKVQQDRNKLIDDVLEKKQWSKSAELERYQWQDIRSLLEHSYINVPFYRRRFNELGIEPGNIRNMDDFRKIPILRKADIQQNLETMRAMNCPAKMLTRNATGGSTGQPTVFYRDLNATEWVLGAKRRYWKWIGYGREDNKLAFIWGANRDIPLTASKNQRWLNSFNCSEEDIERFVAELVNWQPEAIRAYASSLYMVASYIKSKGLRAPRPKSIESSAEKLWGWQRKVVEDVFGCKVYEVYGSREISAIACECDYHNGMHIFSDLRLVEVIKDSRPAKPGEEGSIVITDLINYGMPFIRYEIGDVGVLSDEICPCGRGFPLLKEIKGRITSTIRTPDGRNIHGEYFTHLFYDVPGIKAFQVRQTKLDEIIVSVQPDIHFNRDLIEKIINKIRTHLGARVNVSWKCVDDIPKVVSGKRHFTISDIDTVSLNKIDIGKKSSVEIFKEHNQNNKKILFIVDSPNWAHDFKTDNIIRQLGNSFNMRKCYKNCIIEDDIHWADLIVVYYWKEFNDPNMLGLLEVFRQNKQKVLIGICSHQEMREPHKDKALKFLQQSACGVFVNSMLLYKQFASCFEIPVFYTPNGVDTLFFKPGLTKKPAGILRVGWAGSIKNHGLTKGYQDFVIPAVNSVKGVELVVAAREQEWRSKEKMLEFYRSIDVYICASTAEGTPNPCLEAAACGVPLITTAVGNMPELIKDGINGFFIERDVEDIKKKLIILRDNPQLREKMKMSILESIQEWDWAKQAENYRKMFEQMLSRNAVVEPGQISSAKIEIEQGCESTQYFLQAQDEFNKEKFPEAFELIHKYRASIKYKDLPRFVRSEKKNNIEVSVVIVTYERTEDVRKCIESVNKQQNSGCGYEVIVVDNGLTDESIIKPICDQYIKCPVNLGLSEGRNVGACFARGRIIAFLDDDALVGSDYISSIKEAFDAYDIFGFRGKVLPKTSEEANIEAVNYDRGEEVFCTFCDQEGNSAFLTEVYLNTDGMDPLLFGAEGTDLSYRIIEKYKCSNRIIYWPKTVIYHDNAPQDVQVQKQKRYELMRQYFYLKHSKIIPEYRKEIEEKEKPQKRLPDFEEKQIQISPKKTLKNSDVPVALITYNRPKHTYEVLRALREHNIKNIYIFSDGPKKEEDVEKVQVIRKLARTIDWTKPKIIEQPENVGLARNIVGAADHILVDHDRLIVLEDDCVPQKYFFDYMNGCLERYEDNEKIFGVSGHTVAMPDELLSRYPYDMYFSPRIGSWGWATWKRAWQYRESDLRKLVAQAVQKNVDFTQGGMDVPISIANYLSGKLKDVWTLNWVLSVYNNNGVYIFPTRSHIRNIGNDGTGIHCGNSTTYDSPCCQVQPSRYPNEVFLNDEIIERFKSYFRANPQQSQAAVSYLRSLQHKAELTIGYINTLDKSGGAANVAWMLKEGARRSGCTAKMFVGRKTSTDFDVQIIKDDKLDKAGENTRQGLLYYDIKSTFALPFNPAITNCDIMHFHNLHGDYFNTLGLPELTKNKPCVWTLHDMQSFTGHCAHSFDCERWKTGCGNCPDLSIYPAIPFDATAALLADKKKIYESVDVTIVVPSLWLKEKVSQSILKDKPIELIYNGIDTEIFRQYPKDAARKELGLPLNGVILAYSAQGGMNSPWRDGQCLANTVNHLSSKNNSVYFLNIGGGKGFDVPNTINIPYINDEQKLAKLYSAADIFLFPSLADNCPLVVLEAMSCGLTVVAYKTGGIPELIENGRTGIITPYRNTAGFIKAVEYLINDAQTRNNIGSLAIEAVKNKFSAELMIGQYLNLYQRISGKSFKKVQKLEKKNETPVFKADKTQQRFITSAIVSTYNSERFIRGCLEDLESQTIADRIEIIVVNSGSQENEEAIVKEFQQRYDNIKYIKTQQRETIYQAWNRAIEAASGGYITVANTDDRRRKDAIEIMTNVLDSNEDIALAYADQYETAAENEKFENVTVSKKNIYPNFTPDVFLDLGWGNMGSQPMWRAEIHKEIGNFDGNFEIAGDYDFLLRVCEKYKCFHVPRILGTFYRSAGKTISCSNTFRLGRVENPIAKARSLVRKAIKCVEQADYSQANEYLHKSIQCWPSKEAVEYIQIVEERTGQRKNGNIDSGFEFLTSVWDWPKEMSVTSRAVPVVRQFTDVESGKYLLSVIVPECKSAEEINYCLEELAAQNIADKIEVQVVSKQIQQFSQTLAQYAGSFGNLASVEVIQDENIWAGVNRALKSASGEFVTILRFGYRYGYNSLEKMAEVLKQDVSKAAVYTCVAKGNGIFETDIKLEGLFTEDLNASRLMWRRCLHNQLGWFDESFLVTTEYEFWHRIAQDYSLVRLSNVLESCPSQNSEYDFDMSFEKGLIKKVYQYAGLCKIHINSGSISSHEIFSRWFDVNILKKRTWEKVHNQKYNPVKHVEDRRTNTISPLLSMIIVTCDRNKELIQNLDALSKQSEKNFEVIIINNGSSSFDSGGNNSLNICWINLDNNYGPSLARNIGAEHSRSQYLVFLDDDAIPDCNYVRNIIAHFRQKNICGLRGKILSPVGGYVPDMYDLGDEVIPYAADMEGNCAFTKEAFCKAGGFSEWLFHGEGLDLSYRIYKQAAEDIDCTLYCPDVIIYHQPYGNQLYRLERVLRAELMEKLMEENNPGIKNYQDYMFNFYPINRKDIENKLGRLFNNASFLLDKKPQRAMEWAKIARKDFPTSLEPRFVLGSVYFKTGDLKGAKNELLELFLMMEEVFAQKTQKARDILAEKNESIKEMYLQTVVRLSQCCSQSGDFNTVKSLYERALQNTHVEIPAEQRSSMETLLRKLKSMNLASAPIIPEERPVVVTASSPQKEYLVSAIVSTYNAEDLIRGCLEDLEGQTISDRIEIIVVNSGSQQNEEAIVKEFQSKYDNIVYIRTEQREGIYTAWNRAVKAARGRFLTNANTDDRHRKDALEVLSRELLNNPDVAIVYGDQICTDTRNSTFENHHVVKAEPQPDYTRERLLLGCCVGSQPMWRKSLHNELGYFDETLDCASDWDFWIRVSEKYPLKRVPEFLGIYYYNPEGIEHGKKRHSFYERYAVGKRYGTPYISHFNTYEERKDWLVSVIMPAYNGEKYIREAIESVLIQNYRNFELVIINDGSTDSTEEIIHSYKDEHIRYFKQENRGLAVTHNEGIRKARGEFLIKVDTDDFITVDFIGQHLNEFYSHPDADLVYCDDYLVEEDCKPIRVIKRPEYTDRRMLIRDLFRNGFPVVPFRTCIRRRVFEKIGFFQEDLRIGEDYDMMRRFVRAGLKAHHLRAPLYYRRLTSDSLSRKYHIEKARQHFGIVDSYAQTFTPEELFPDVQWDMIPAEMRDLHFRCLTAVNFISLGQVHIESRLPSYAGASLELASRQLKSCLEIAPGNREVAKLLNRCQRLEKNLCETALVNT